MTLKFYAVPVSLYCAKTRILMRHKGIDWQELAPPGGYGSDTYKEIVPSGNLPAIDDGQVVLADSEAIAEYLNERFAAPPMLPDDILRRAKARELGRFHDTRLEPALRVFFASVGLQVPDRDVIESNAVALNARLVQLGRMLADAPREMLTLGDCGYAPTFLWIERLAGELAFDVTWPEPVRDYRNWLYDQPAVADEMASYRNDFDPWIEAKRKERGGGT